MTRKIVRSILLSATLLVSLAAVATAQDDRICSTPGLAGEWGYTSTGGFIFPTGAVPFALVGRLTFDAAGNFSGAQNSSTGGQVGQKTIKTSVLTFVIVDNGREVGGIFTLQTLANGTNGPTVATFNAKRQFPRTGQ
jgi:hypothetical protein